MTCGDRQVQWFGNKVSYASSILPSTVITLRGAERAGRCPVSHCDHPTSGRVSWSLFCLAL